MERLECQLDLDKSMGIEYLAGFKPGDIIDLSRFGKKPARFDSSKKENEKNREKTFSPEDYVDLFRKDLGKMAAEVNDYFPGFLGKDGKIALAGRDAEKDASLVAAQEDAFSRDFYGNKPEDMEAWRRQQEAKDPSLTEMSLTLLLNKFLKKDFIVARASSYDDYNNGIDNVLIDKASGEVLCGFDEVMVKRGESTSSKKENKLSRLMAKGGAYLKYGARLENNRLVRAAVSNIPAFYISLDKQELEDLMVSLRNPSGLAEGVEEKIFQKLLASLEDQLSTRDLDNNLRQKASSALLKLQSFQKPVSVI